MPVALEMHRPSSLRTLAARTPNLSAARRRDPARIRPLQARLIREFKRRYAALIRDIRTSIVDRDCFGLRESIPRVLVAVPPGAYAFEITPQKIGSFLNWLKEQQAAGILDIHVRAGVGASAVTPEWSGVYVDSYYQRGLREAYQKSIVSARANLEKAGYGSSMAAMQPMSIYMQQPFHVDRVGLIYSRVYEDLKTITQFTDAAVRRTITEGLTTGLARGMAEGINSEKIGRQLFKDVANKVNQIGLARAIMIARTETARAAHVATIAEYRRASVAGVNVMAEVVTSGLDNVCELCEDLAAGGPYTLDRVEWMIPAHPHCACTSVPLLNGDALRPSDM